MQREQGDLPEDLIKNGHHGNESDKGRAVVPQERVERLAEKLARKLFETRHGGNPGDEEGQRKVDCAQGSDGTRREDA